MSKLNKITASLSKHAWIWLALAAMVFLLFSQSAGAGTALAAPQAVLVAILLLGVAAGALFFENRSMRAKLAGAGEREEELRQQLITDELTGLFNRRYLSQRLEEELRHAQRYRSQLAILMCDLDGFKRLNDSHGYEFGNRALQRFTQLANGAVRAVDLACRYGGEEFLMLLPNTDATGAMEIAERLRKSVSDADFEGEKLTVSIGVASIDDLAAPSAHGLLEASEWALYQAKQSGRNRICVAYRGGPRRATQPG